MTFTFGSLPHWRLFLLLATLSLAACTPSDDGKGEADTAHDEPTAVEDLADEILSAWLKRYPEMATMYSLRGVDQDRLFDNSRKALKDWQEREDEWLDELAALGEPSEVGSRDWVTWGVLHETLQASSDARICHTELWSAAAATSWHTGVPSLFEIQAVETQAQREQLVDRLADLARYLDTEIRNLQHGLELGFSAPRVTVEPAPAEIRALLGPDSPLLSAVRRSEDPEFAALLQQTFDEITAPAIARYADFLEQDYLPAAREDISLEAHPDGVRCYDALVRQFATIGPDAETIHQLGLEQIAAIRAEMQTILDAHFPGYGIEAFMQAASSDPRFTFESEDAVLQYSLDALDAARDAMPSAFGLLPRADVLIKPYPPHRQSGTGEYQSSSEDGSRPGVYLIAVTDPTRRSRAAQQSVLYHETYPGHHLQGAIALELGAAVHPLVRYLWNSGYGEGWALYSERLADELGLYSGPLDRMGMLSDQAARAARLVIDSGIHRKGWTRQQSEDYMLANTAWAPVDVRSEILRYIAWPGQATSYMLGMLEIRRLRERAESELGADFNLAEFHDRVLENGSITLPMLERKIDAWLEP